jgi:hypothetical protein
MARISVRVVCGRRRISVRGHLGSGDLRRLERACGRALEQKLIPVDLCLAPDVTVDESATAFLTVLADRGAAIVNRPFAGRIAQTGTDNQP